MQNKLLLFWAWVSVVMPLMLGVLFLLNPMGVVPAGSSVADMARLLGVKNIVYSCLLLYAVLKKSKLLLSVLLLGRGVTDVVDGLTGISLGYMAPPYFGAITTGLITIGAGYWLTKQKET